MAKKAFNELLELDKIFLDLENPRHEPYDTEGEVIEYLCRVENITTLAKDIVENGLNPIEQFAVIPDDDSYFVAEGNRRTCALKLLNDPDRAPTKYRKTFSNLAENWDGVGLLPCVVFADRIAVKPWLSRIHDGQQGGIGRSKWNADQSQRHSGSTKNKIALTVLDYAQDNGLISADERKGTITTVQRYLVKKPVQDAMGLDTSDLDNIKKTKSKPDFDKLLGKFLDDLKSGYVNSRSKGAAVYEAYGRELSGAKLSKKGTIKSEPLEKGSDTTTKETSRRRAKPKARTTLPFEHEIMDGLKEIESHKLISLYDSITKVPLNQHAPLVSVGAWAFMESLAGRAGRTETTFEHFFTNERIASYGLATGKNRKPIRDAIDRIAASGDATKHDDTSAMFNGEQLANDMDRLKKLILKCIDEAASKID